MSRTKSKAQSIVESIVLVIAVVVVLIAFLPSNGDFANAIRDLIAVPFDMMNK